MDSKEDRSNMSSDDYMKMVEKSQAHQKGAKKTPKGPKEKKPRLSFEERVCKCLMAVGVNEEKAEDIKESLEEKPWVKLIPVGLILATAVGLSATMLLGGGNQVPRGGLLRLNLASGQLEKVEIGVPLAGGQANVALFSCGKCKVLMPGDTLETIPAKGMYVGWLMKVVESRQQIASPDAPETWHAGHTQEARAIKAAARDGSACGGRAPTQCGMTTH